MTILYKVHSNEHGRDLFVPNKCLQCKISSKNIVAFSVCKDANTYSNHIYVCDVVTPWQSFKLCSSKYPVTVLDWNYSGELLLVGYKGGTVEIWSPRNQLLDNWRLLYKVNFSGEDIINSKFFYNGKSTYFHTQKRESPFYAEKFERLDHRPSLANFGAAAVEGCLIMTASGLLGAFVIPKYYPVDDNKTSIQQGIELSVATQSIGLSRNFITTCSMTHCSNGCFNVAVNFNSQEQIIHCFKVCIKMENEDNLLIICESISSVFIMQNEQKKITHLRWSSINNDDIIYIAFESIDGGILEQWNLTKKNQIVHSLLQKNKGEFIHYESWENVAKIRFSAGIGEITLSKLLSDNSQIFVILKDNTVQVLESGLKKIGSTIFERFSEDRQFGCRYVAADISCMNQILFVFDNYGHMYAMQVSFPFMDKSFNSMLLQVSLLEYCIITGFDASDILMLNFSNLDVLIEKLTENFMRQPAYTRHFYYSNFLSLKSNICRIQSKQQDFDSLIILHSISITFKSLLRPSDLSCQDKGPADNLSIILSDPLADVDKVLFNLDAKDFTVEPLTLQSLQHLIQWVADLALNILNKLPEEVIKSKLNKKKGYEISRDIVAIGSIRELLVMIRIWGLLNSQCLPMYVKSVENIDVLSVLFRLLTRLAQNISDPDECILDDCNLLSTQVVIPSRQNHNPTTLLNCHMSAYKMFPLVFTTSVDPVGMQDIQVEQVLFANGTRDGVTNLHLGSKIGVVKKCARCGFVNNMQKVAKTSALKAWCHRWIYCHCGGYWKTT